MKLVEVDSSAEDNAFASMMAMLLEQNIEGDSKKQGVLAQTQGRVCIQVEDLGLATTMYFRDGGCMVYGGTFGIPDLLIRATAEIAAQLSTVELLPGGIPDPRGEVSKTINEATKKGELEVLGLPASLPLMWRFTRVMNVNP